METREEFKKAREVILEILKTDERARNSDLWLQIQVWRKQGINIYVPYDKLDKMFSPETIRRTRQTIQNDEKLYPPTRADVKRKRRTRGSEIHQMFAQRRMVE